MIDIHHHIGVTLIQAENMREFLMGVYDNTYPHPIYRGRVNLIGGNISPKDKSPYGLAERELKEEFSMNSTEKEFDPSIKDIIGTGPIPKRGLMAPEQCISSLKNAVLSNLIPYQDFLAITPELAGRIPFNMVISVYSSKISQDIFENARKNLNAGREVKVDGHSRITTIEELLKGEPLIIPAIGSVIENYLNVKDRIPKPEKVGVYPMGLPRASFKDYFSEFIYPARIAIENT
ncbi:hypothetical protein HYT26_00115 [Candidatus Pacearchaeota archaeon]|nr:hypothetical protein [Candidatus Pacearchaeota archaeon]